MAIKDEAMKVMHNPRLRQNLRGQLSAISSLLDDKTKKQFACDFAEHIGWIWEKCTENNPIFKEAISKTRQFLHSSNLIDQVQEIRTELMKLRYDLQRYEDQNSMIANIASWVVILAIEVCCLQELAEVKFVVASKHKPSIESVSRHASYTVARYAGGLNWDSDDVKLRTDARKRGKLASDGETKWQLQHILDYIEKN